MPVAKKPVRRTPRQADHQAIKDLVRDLPSLIMQDSDNTAVPVSQVPVVRRPVVVHSDPSQRRWVWIGVAICTLAIGAFWIYNMRSLVVHTFDGRSIEKNIAHSTTQDLQALLDTVMINNEKLRQTAPSSTTQTNSTAPSEEALRAALLATLVTSTPTTSTPSTPTVTTTTN